MFPEGVMMKITVEHCDNLERLEESKLLINQWIKEQEKLIK